MNALVNGDLEADAAEARRKLEEAAGIEILCPRSADACGVSVRLVMRGGEREEIMLRALDMHIDAAGPLAGKLTLWLCDDSHVVWSGPFRQAEPILRWKDMP